MSPERRQTLFCHKVRFGLDSVILDEAVSVLLQAQVHPALGAPDHAALLASRQLAAALLLGDVLGPVVVAVQPDSLGRVARCRNCLLMLVRN